MVASRILIEVVHDNGHVLFNEVSFYVHLVSPRYVVFNGYFVAVVYDGGGRGTRGGRQV